MIERTLKVLMLEDLKTDQELIKRGVLKAAPEAVFIIASNREEFEDKLNWVVPDLILGDYNIPGYNGLEALLLVREKIPHVPFIFVTGSLNDEQKVAETILKGASGYILKERLSELPERVEQVLRQEESRFKEREVLIQQKKRKQLLLQKLEAILKNSSDFPAKSEALEIMQEVLQITGIK